MFLNDIMKKAVAMSVVATAFYANSQTMTVNFTDGSSRSYECDKIASVKFSAPQGDFALEVTDVTATTARLSVTPENENVRYYYDVCTLEQFEQYGVEAIVEDYIDYMCERYSQLSLAEILDALLSRGADEDEVKGLPVDTEMAFYAVAVNDDGRCEGNASVMTFRTQKGGNPAECTFQLSATGLYSEGVTMNVRPSDTSVRYWAGVYSVSGWGSDEAMTALVKSTIDEAAEENGMALDRLVNAVTFQGPVSLEESGLQNSTNYYIYAYAMNPDGTAAGPVSKLLFTTPVVDISDADVSLRYRYFDGDAMAEAYPDRFAKAAGRVVMQIQIVPNEMAENFAWALAMGDLGDTETYPDDASKNAVLQGGFINKAEKELIVNYGAATFFYFASDVWGVDGRFHRLVVDVTKDGVMPVSEYTPFDTAPAPARVLDMPAKDKCGRSVIAARVRASKTEINHFRGMAR